MHEEFVTLLRNNENHAVAFDGRFDDLQESQDPGVVTVCCSDSRVLQDRMWDNDGPGRIFTVGNIGNRVRQRTDEGEAVSGDVLYPIVHADAHTAVVVGHTGCGAVTAAHDALTDGLDEPPGIAHSVDLVVRRIRPGYEALPADLDRAAAVNRLVEYNVDRGVAALRGSEDVPDDVTAVGVVYDFQDVYGGRRGEVHVINVDGETGVGALRADHPEVEDRIRRLWDPDA